VLNHARKIALATLLGLALVGCGGGESGNEAVSSPTPSAVSPTPSPATVPPESPAAAEATVNFLMPNFVGMNLQDAQNKVQTYGIFFSRSHDLLGSRSQIIDSNWKVCTQTPAKGTRIKGKAADYEGKFDFGAVKLTESCP
jgi:hypothetical protein